MQKTVSLYIFLIYAFAVLSLAGLILILYFLDPGAGALNRFLFYADFAVFAFMLSTLAGFSLRKRLGQREFVTRHFTVSVRQAFWFTTLITFSLFLLSNDLLSWLNTSLLVVALVFLESFFLSRQKSNQ